MRILILGGDGYLGWPTAMYLSARGHDVAVADNMLRRRMHLERGTNSLTPIKSLQQRVEAWRRESGREVRAFVGDLCDPAFATHVVEQTRPEAIIHYGEQPSAPYSMIDREHAVFSQRNNVEGNLNILWAMKEHAPDCHLVKLGTMGEYGTPNIDIEEGYIEIEHNGRKDTLPFPKLPGSFYHLSKVHDSHNIHFACRIWGFRATDLNQGVVYGIETDQTKVHPDLMTRSQVLVEQEPHREARPRRHPLATQDPNPVEPSRRSVRGRHGRSVHSSRACLCPGSPRGSQPQVG